MSGNIKEDKKSLRNEIKEKLSQLNEEAVKEQSYAVMQMVLHLPEYQNASSISIFLSMPQREISTTGIVLDALQQGKKVFIPYIHSGEASPKSKVMDMLRLQDEVDLQGLRPDAWGIPSLQAESIAGRENAFGGKGILNSASDKCCSTQLDLIFMPGMAFDVSNNRLGHGKGFYDRYLSRIRRTLGDNDSHKFPPLGLALREQLLAPGHSVPATDDDWKIDQLVVPR